MLASTVCFCCCYSCPVFSLDTNRPVIVPQMNVRVPPIRHGPVEVIVTQTWIVYRRHFGVVGRLELGENESLMRLTVQRKVRQSVDVEDDDVALVDQ